MKKSDNAGLSMSDEQASLFKQLTRLQKKTAINVLKGMDSVPAYLEAGGRAKSKVTRRICANEILSNPSVSEFIESMQSTAANAALCTAEDLVKALMCEAGINTDKIPPDTKQAGRVAAIKILSEYTGGFDKNKQQIEHTGYIGMTEDDLYD